MGAKPDSATRQETGGMPAAGAYAFLSSVKFAIFLLALIAAACILGTLIPQQAPAEAYMQRYSEATYAVLAFLGLADVFHASWFFCLAGLFVLNLVLCTVRRLLRSLKDGGVRMPSGKALSAMPLRFVVKGAPIGRVEHIFRGYRARRTQGGTVLEKGRISKYAVYIIHASVIVILAGGLIGLVAGYRGTMTLAKGQTKDYAEARGGSRNVPLGFAVKLDAFDVSFYPGGEPKDYMSRVEIVDGGRVVRRADIRVNHPLSYKGASIYQASYGKDPMFLFDIGGEEVSLGQGAAYRKGGLAMMVVRFEPSVHDFGPGVQVAYTEKGETKTAWLVKDVPRLARKELSGVPVSLKGVRNDYYTGLEVAHDPGVPVVWTGFALMLFGLYANFFVYHRRIFLVETSEGIVAAGAAAKNREAFGEEFEKWRAKAHDLER